MQAIFSGRYNMKDYYQIIGVPYNASADDIRKAYRKQVIKFHPDKNPGNARAHAIFLEIQEAYEILSNEQKRKQFHIKSSYPINDRKQEKKTSSQSILVDAQALKSKVASIGHYRLNPKMIAQQLAFLLNEENLQLLRREPDILLKEQIAIKMLSIARYLPYDRMRVFMKPLLSITNTNAKATEEVLRIYHIKKKWRFWEKYNVAIIIGATIIICLLILLLAS